MSPSMSLPSPDTGCAAPMLVPGAIAATWAARVINVPAEAARAPLDETYTTVGTLAFNSALTISRVESTSPPGVSSWKITATALASSARRILSVIYSRMTGLITPSTWCTSITVSAPVVTAAHHSHMPPNTRHRDHTRTAIRTPTPLRPTHIWKGLLARLPAVYWPSRPEAIATLQSARLKTTSGYVTLLQEAVHSWGRE